MHKLIVKNFLVKLGGEQHTGWLPDAAAEPLPTPVKEILIDFEIEENSKDGGFLLVYQSRSKEFCGDTWHPTKRAAINSARQ